MAWSRLKMRWRALLGPAVAGRVDVHMAGYRKAYERRGRAWITVDRQEIASFCEFTYENAWRDESLRETPRGRFTTSANAAIRAIGYRDKGDLLAAMSACIGSSIDDLIQSDEFLIRGLAMLDRRLGKRRLAQFDITSAHPFVATLYELRCTAEGIHMSSASA